MCSHVGGSSKLVETKIVVVVVVAVADDGVVAVDSVA